MLSIRTVASWLFWISTALIIISVGLLAFDIQPIGMWISFAGVLACMIAACMWREWSLASATLIISAIYVANFIGLFAG